MFEFLIGEMHYSLENKKKEFHNDDGFTENDTGK